MTAIITVNNISKRYRRGAMKAGSATIRDSIAEWFRRRPQVPAGSGVKDLWALKDVSFSVTAGDIVGVIGINGAGKSTLLKILSRTTKPTSGTADLLGRVGSLLEIGTGFHHELTGRENIYFNGSILGMQRAEIQAKFDEIVSFAEIAEFLDTPVKHYSSGMYMRLAFAVAAHLETEILIVDEVLAVGDINFQRKCLNKMKDTNEQGRTVLFVSHSMQAIARLCTRCLLFAEGRLVMDGPTSEVIDRYLNSSSLAGAERRWLNDQPGPGDEYVRLLSIRVHDEIGRTTATLDIRRPTQIEMIYEVLQDGIVFMPNYQLYNAEGTCVFATHDLDADWRTRPRPIGRYLSRALIPANFLAEGSHFVTVAATTYSPFKVHLIECDVISFLVVDSLAGDSARGDFSGVMPGIVRPILSWTTNYLDQ